MSEAPIASSSTDTSVAAPLPYAVVRLQGKQYRVLKGDTLEIDRLEGEVGSTITMAEVLMTSDGVTPKIGAPLVAGASVKAKILAHDLGEKVIIYKKRRRKGYHKKQGHRQEQTRLQIEEIC